MVVDFHYVQWDGVGGVGCREGFGYMYGRAFYGWVVGGGSFH